MKKVVINPAEAIRSHKLFEGLDEALLKQLETHLRFQLFLDRQMVVQQGSTGDALLLIFSGRLQVIAFSDDGREVGIHFLDPGSFFGEASVIDGQPRSSSVVALADTVVGFLPKNISMELMTRHPAVAERVMRSLCHTIREGSRMRAALTAARAHARIFSVLNNTVTHHPGANLATIENMPTQQALAMMANVSRESVSRALQLLIKQGVVEKDHRRLIVRQPQVLETMASGAETPPIAAAGATPPASQRA